jgi:hypothetical protein
VIFSRCAAKWGRGFQNIVTSQHINIASMTLRTAPRSAVTAVVLHGALALYHVLQW